MVTDMVNHHTWPLAIHVSPRQLAKVLDLCVAWAQCHTRRPTAVHDCRDGSDLWFWVI